MSVNLPQPKARSDRFDGRLFLTDENLDRGALAILGAAHRLQTLMKAAQPSDWTDLQWALICEIALRPGIDVKGLREAVGGTVPTVARVLAELDKAGYVSRGRQTNDSRKKSLSLTETGTEKLAAALKKLRPSMTDVYRQSGEPAVTGALMLLEQVHELPLPEPQTK